MVWRAGGREPVHDDDASESCVFDARNFYALHDDEDLPFFVLKLLILIFSADYPDQQRND